ncbi:hypothetical protein INT46_004897 [Mucor plumbeus]|jgi:hypothetical protein|uniref:Uncharacterized protein n=1 Tax=Mucor plumbeus TaxID=97098 RepID=A0A8H7QM91_9FUNG|nr:hypothetical protein INT46_004897 [Mucor plumbeus]
MAPNTNQILFIVIFSLLAFILVLLTYVCWLKRMKMRAKRDILAEQHQLERQQQAQNNVLTTAELQRMKPVLLQQLYERDLQRSPAAPAYSNPFDDTPQYTPNDEHVLVDIHDERERDATIIHTEQQYNNASNNSRR